MQALGHAHRYPDALIRRRVCGPPSHYSLEPIWAYRARCTRLQETFGGLNNFTGLIWTALRDTHNVWPTTFWTIWIQCSEHPEHETAEQ
ncbi:hypothetical protein P879_10204 [Paragonimus westermani]|uniref:Uncharacterized protein n=1 Tax=Paragonimus westermani TaxID=34504 RepID=A0A8T0D020_9TREM|nr:hypothetical protein P879_10204 [Paragonimus westermani]